MVENVALTSFVIFFYIPCYQRQKDFILHNCRIASFQETVKQDYHSCLMNMREVHHILTAPVQICYSGPEVA